MRLCRYLDRGEICFGVMPADESVINVSQLGQVHQLPLEGIESLLDLLPGGKLHAVFQQIESRLDPSQVARLAQPVGSIQLVTPLASPGKFIALAGNYPLHIKEGGGQAEERSRTIPYLFLKPSNTFTNPGDPVIIPDVSPHQIDWEIELGVVIGKSCRGVSEAEALDYVAGYTVVNDISDRAYRPNPSRETRPRDVFFDWQHGKWHDTFCPWGPAILPASECPDPQQLQLILKVNDQVEQNGSTADMVFPVAAIIEFVSRTMTLQPGDVISTGTPDGVGKAKGKFLKAGDVLSASIPGIGTLMNPVR